MPFGGAFFASTMCCKNFNHLRLLLRYHPSCQPIDEAGESRTTCALRPLRRYRYILPSNSPNNGRRTNKKNFSSLFREAIVKNFLPLGFLIGLVFSLLNPEPGVQLGKLKFGDFRILSTVNTCLVFIISGLSLQSDDFVAILKQPFGAIIGLVSILLLTPLLSLLTQRLPLQPPEFALGLSIFCLVPTTLSVGVALTAVAKGNQALALVLTVVSNILGIVTCPFLLKHLFQGSSSAFAAIDPVDLSFKLAVTVLAPTALGYVLQTKFRQVQGFVKRNKTALSLFSSFNLQLMVWQNLSGARDLLLKQRPINILNVVLSGICVHLVYLALNLGLLRLLPAHMLSSKEAIAVLIMASQKSAPVAITILNYITKDPAVQGLSSIPAIVAQLGQIFIGSFIAPHLSSLFK